MKCVFEDLYRKPCGPECGNCDILWRMKVNVLEEEL